MVPTDRPPSKGMAWPKIRAVTATYIGLRTKRYKPRTIRVRVGATGAGVPSPSKAKRAKASRVTASPATIRMRPVQRAVWMRARGCHKDLDPDRRRARPCAETA